MNLTAVSRLHCYSKTALFARETRSFLPARRHRQRCYSTRVIPALAVRLPSRAQESLTHSCIVLPLRFHHHSLLGSLRIFVPPPSRVREDERTRRKGRRGACRLDGPGPVRCYEVGSTSSPVSLFGTYVIAVSKQHVATDDVSAVTDDDLQTEHDVPDLV